MSTLERVLGQSAHSSLPNFNTAVATVVHCTAAAIDMLLGLQRAYLRQKTSFDTASSSSSSNGSSSGVGNSHVVQWVQANKALMSTAAVSTMSDSMLSTNIEGRSSIYSHQPQHRSYYHTNKLVLDAIDSAYRVVCRSLSNMAVSKDMEKHAHLIAASLVDNLCGGEPLPRSFRDNIFPGLFALFERCQLKQKNGMFAMLSQQSRAFMQEVHSEYMRTYKFVGK
jgi:hypothetical protein